MNDIELKLADGSRASISHFGGQVLQWHAADGIERLYMSPMVVRDGALPIRGGVPVCWPQFNMRVIGGRTLPKHGFARNAIWRLTQLENQAEQAHAVLALCQAKAQRSDWPFAFEAQVHIKLQPGSLQVDFELHNQDQQGFEFALALHTYFAVDNIASASLHGLEGASFMEHAAHAQKPLRWATESALLHFSRETDRVYANAPARVELREPGRGLGIENTGGLCDTVVWNPGEEGCGAFKDIPADGYKHLLCVEASVIEQPVRLAPGASWRGGQTLTVLH